MRFFRDGRAISLLSTAEPADVVHRLTPDLLRHGHQLQQQQQHLVTTATTTAAASSSSSSAAAAPPAARLALRGRWRLDDQDERLLVVETEGVDPKYLYRMDLALRSAARAPARNTRLAWRAFASYNRLTDDWAAFGLANDRPFVFSRVRSYG
ncbi:hypothetical protein CDD83_9804 [Cordyceps sp. RAO-2017]|nr:hypothetical protein CDD83_9804 [Cordyceps sp. RAO-2017]